MAKPLFLRSALRPAWSIFRDGTDQANPLTLKEKLRAGNFASLVAQRREPVRPGQNKIEIVKISDVMSFDNSVWNEVSR